VAIDKDQILSRK